MILVTGAAGLLGQTLVQQLLLNNEKVVALINNTPLTIENNPNLIIRNADILDVEALSDAMHDITQIYHCAAVVSFNTKDKPKLYKINVEGTANIVNVALTAGIKKLVHVSSVAALGRIRNNETVDENMYWTPSTSNSVYGETKYKGEMEVWRGIAEGLDAVIINPSIIIGTADWNNSSTAIFKNVYNEFNWYSTGSTGWVDVQDVAKAMIALMKSNIINERFIVSGHNETYQTVFNLAADAFNKKRPAKKVTPFLAAVVWRIEKIKSWFTGTKPLVTKETAATALTNISYNNQKLLQAVPSFEYTDLKNSITRICNELLKLKN
jgi:dihydroflavonol-4-reductase